MKGFGKLAKSLLLFIKQITMQKAAILIFSCLMLNICSCQNSDKVIEENQMNDVNENTMINKEEQAVISNVEISGSENNYSFSVTIKSPDTGCEQYADWWEVFDRDGNLIYRRILGHSHVSEQPFTRSGGPVKISKDQFIYVRAHMNPLGYGTYVFGGTVENGLQQEVIDKNTAADLENAAPLPTGCAF